ncbi:MAG: tetratricopeptide repeat protein [Candidatus Omnitrophota bacterium]
MRRIFSVISILVFMGMSLIPAVCLAETADELFFEANKAYSEGDYEKAAALYEEIAAKGAVSGNLYYDLGNAYFKSGKKGKALVCYERAGKFIPQDEDLRANYAFVRSLMDIKQPEEKYPWYEKAFISARDSFSPGAWYFISLMLFLSVCVLIGVSFFKTRYRKKIYLASAVLGVLFFLSMFVFQKGDRSGKYAKTGIIIVPAAEVRYSPSYSGAVAFELTEGTKAQILRKEGDWSQIRLTRRNSGWVESSAIEEI